MISIFKRSSFLFILAPLVFYYFIILNHHWIPVHDTLSSFFLGYSFFSHFAEHGTFPFWANYLDWGQPINMSLMANVSPLYIFMGPFAKFFPQANLMTFYYLSLFLEELLLAIGTYLLANRLYKHTLTKIFITTIMTASSIWMIEIFFNFRLFYSMPLCLFLFIKTMDTNRLRYFLVSLAILFLTSSWGNALYIGIFQCLFFAAFAFFYFFINKVDLRKLKKNFTLPEAIALLMFLTIAIASVAFLLAPGLPAFISPGRSFDGKLDYLDFLRFNKDHYTTSMNGILYGLREWRDGTVYTGFLTVPFALLCLVYRPLKIIVPFIGAAAFTFFLYLSEESFIAPFLFFLPGIKLVRHGYLLTPYIKLCIVFIAGFGFDYFYTTAKRKGDRFNSLLRFLSIIVFLLTLGFFIDWKSMGKDAKSLSTSYIVLTYSIIFIWLNFWGKKVFNSIILLLTILSTVDIYNYKIGYTHNTLVPVSDSEWELFKPRKIEFWKERTYENSHTSFTDKANPELFYTMLNVTEQFLGVDKCSHEFRSDSITPNARNLYSYIESKYKFNHKLEPELEKIIACGTSKFQLFNEAPIPTAKALKKLSSKFIQSKTEKIQRTQTLNRDIFTQTWRDFSGRIKTKESYDAFKDPRNMYYDFYFEFGAALNQAPPKISTLAKPQVDITFFDANHLKFKLKTIENKNPSYWLYIAEAWHPKWKAFVNGNEEKIEIANLAFRTFQVPKGESIVEMIYHCKLEKILICIVWVFSALLFILIALTTLILSLNPSLPPLKKWSKILGLLE